MSILAPQRQTKTVSEARNVAVSFAGKLDSGELLSGTPTVVEVASTDLTLSDKAINTSQLVINGITVIVGHAVQFKVIGGVANNEYEIRITVATDSTPAQSLIGSVKLLVVAD